VFKPGEILPIDIDEEPAEKVMKPVTLCPNCGYSGNTPFLDCPDCGIVVEKYLRLRSVPNTASLPPPPPAADPETGRFSEWLLNLPEETGAAGVLARGIFLAVLAIWGLSLILSSPASNQAGNSFLHLINLPFHEAGHIFFSPLGKFVTSLGGTLGQLLIPLICGVTLIWRAGDPFGGAVSLWWFGENFIDIAPYINDARAGVLPLIGGNSGQTAPYGFHDWQYLLNESGLLAHDHGIATSSHWFGAGLMLVALVWGAMVLHRHYLSIHNAVSVD